jgi:hypothetical protein
MYVRSARTTSGWTAPDCQKSFPVSGAVRLVGFQTLPFWKADRLAYRGFCLRASFLLCYVVIDI